MKGIRIEPLVQSLFAWVNATRQAAGQPIIAIDGKTRRGAVNPRHSEHALHRVSAFDTGEGLVLCHPATRGKGGEIESVRQRIDCLDSKGAMIILDALHCQKETLQKLTACGADVVVQVKGNPPRRLRAIRHQFQPEGENKGEGLAQHTTRHQAQGRREERTTFQSATELPDDLKEAWPGVRSLIAGERSRRHKGKGTLDTLYYVSSLAVNPEQAARAVRQHWHIGNQQHWVLDVTYREDLSRIGDREAAETFALFRRIALNRAQHHPKQISKRRKQSDAHAGVMISGWRCFLA